MFRQSVVLDFIEQNITLSSGVQTTPPNLNTRWTEQNITLSSGVVSHFQLVRR